MCNERAQCRNAPEPIPNRIRRKQELKRTGLSGLVQRHHAPSHRFAGLFHPKCDRLALFTQAVPTTSGVTRALGGAGSLGFDLGHPEIKPLELHEQPALAARRFL